MGRTQAIFNRADHARQHTDIHGRYLRDGLLLLLPLTWGFGQGEWWRERATRDDVQRPDGQTTFVASSSSLLTLSSRSFHNFILS